MYNHSIGEQLANFALNVRKVNIVSGDGKFGISGIRYTKDISGSSADYYELIVIYDSQRIIEITFPTTDPENANFDQVTSHRDTDFAYIASMIMRYYPKTIKYFKEIFMVGEEE